MSAEPASSLPTRRLAGWGAALFLLLGITAGCGVTSTGFLPLDGGDDEDLSLADLATAPADLNAPPRLTSAVSVVVEPGAGSSPITTAISGAKSSISVEVYLLTDNNVVNSLIAARKAGRTVKVILEMNPTGTNNNNNAYSQLLSGGVAVKWASNAYNFTHAKSMIVDGTTLYAMTLNLSVSAVTDNREYMLVDTDPSDVAEAQSVFEADWAHSATPPVANLVVSPTTARGKLDKIIGSATSRLDIEWEALSDTQVALRIQDRVRAGVKTSIIVPSNIMGTASQTVLGALKGAGASIKLLDHPYIHAKMILVDRDRGFVGSENATANSLDNNREIGVLWQNADVARKIGMAFDADWAAGTPF